MPTANYDSSELTRRRANRELALYNSNLAAARLVSNYVRGPEQNAFQVLSIVTERQQGGCQCVDSFVRLNSPAIGNPVQ
jgi:hypothetical protein